MLMHGTTPVTEAIIHTSATPAQWSAGKTVEQMRDEIDRWHRENGWSGIGYHYVIAPDGSLATGRPIDKPGAHVKGRNTGSLGICLVPVAWVDRIGHFEDFYTAAQKGALRNLLRNIAGRTNLQKISGHNQYSNKLCPGFNVELTGWLDLQAIKSGAKPIEKKQLSPVDGPWGLIVSFFRSLFGR